MSSDRAEAIQRSICPIKRVRLGIPVSASWVAWWASRSSARFRSVMSTQAPVM